MHLDLMEVNSMRACIFIVSSLQWDRFLFQFEMPIALSQSGISSVGFNSICSVTSWQDLLLVYLYCADILLSQNSLSCLRWVSH